MLKVDLELWDRDADKAVSRGDLIIVIDALRSATSMVNALKNGAKAIIPAITLKEAYEMRVQNGQYLLAGERGGHKPPGFDLGNSPQEFTNKSVGRKTLVMTTTSGTIALVRSQTAKWILVGAFLNAKATAKKAEQIATNEELGISFVLAGEKGRFSLEDFLCAGAIASQFVSAKVSFSDKVEAAVQAFLHAKNDLEATVVKAEHAKHLIKQGLEQDIVFSCKLNILNEVPIYRAGKITLL